MKIKTTFIILMSVLIVGIYSCEDIFEKNLGKKDIILMSPSNGLETNISTNTFWWEEVDGADHYNLQIVSPSFSIITKLLLDTNITKNKFSFSLLPGVYQWRVKAYNNSSATDYVTYSLTIDSTADITQQIILLASPANNDTTNQTSFKFKWDTLYNADDYRFEIWTPDFNGSKVLSIILETDTFDYTLSEGKYEWGVRGQNSSTNTQYSIRSLFVDTTAPNVPILLTPANNVILNNGTIDFSWSRGTVTGSSINDSLYIFTDSLMTNIKRQKNLNATTYTDSIGTGSFFWRVRSIDAAGNKSGYSVLGKFNVQ